MSLRGSSVVYPFPLPPLPEGLDYNHALRNINTVWVRDSSFPNLSSGGVCRAIYHKSEESPYAFVKVKNNNVWRDHSPATYPTLEDAVNVMVMLLWLGEINWREATRKSPTPLN